MSKETKEIIFDSAARLFQKNGFKSTTVRQIAEKSKTNIALISYYYGDKEKLFREVLKKSLLEFRSGLYIIVHNPETSLDEKFTEFTDYYYRYLNRQPELAGFVMAEMQRQPEKTVATIQKATQFKDSVFYRQIRKEMKPGTNGKRDPLQVLINLYALTVFPFNTTAMIKNLSGPGKNSTERFIEDRKNQIPLWIKAIHF